MSEVYDCTDPQGSAVGVAAAAEAVRNGRVVVLPTDTVYGVGCDPFDAAAVGAVLAAKGRGREMPPPVLVPDRRTLDGLARDLPDYVGALVAAFWPGPLTLVCPAQSSLRWDLGDTNGTVAVRMPADETALALLQAVGPMAVTSANRTGMPPATTGAQAREQLGEAVAVYLDAGPLPDSAPSTILDCTGGQPVTLREGAVSAEAIDAVLDALRDAVASAQGRALREAQVLADRARRNAVREREAAARASDPRRSPGPKVAGSRRRR